MFKLSLKKHPKELWILSLTELCERFSFWGVGFMLVLYLIEHYHLPNSKATHIYGIFTGFAAFLPLVGGWIADRWNYQTPILLGALINAVGCFILSTGESHFLYFALFMIACGYGVFTPSILTVLGHAYRDKPELREAGFSIYYASINVGVFLALASLGTIAKLASWNVAFFVAGMVQIIGLIPLVYYLMKHKKTPLGTHRLQGDKKTHHKLQNKEKKRMWVIVIFCLVSILFWTAYNQAFSSMAIFAHDFMDKKVFGTLIPEGVFMSSESLFLIILAPILATLYSKLQKKKRDPSPSTKTAISLFFMAACFFVMMIASANIPSDAKSADVSWMYVVGAYFLMAIAEMLLAPIGLSMVSRLAPARYTALGIGFWYVCVGIAFYNGGVLAGLMEKMGGLFNFFSIFVIMTLIPAFGMFLFSKKLTQLAHDDSHTSQSFTDVER